MPNQKEINGFFSAASYTNAMKQLTDYYGDQDIMTVELTAISEFPFIEVDDKDTIDYIFNNCIQ